MPLPDGDLCLMLDAGFDAGGVGLVLALLLVGPRAISAQARGSPEDAPVGVGVLVGVDSSTGIDVEDAVGVGLRAFVGSSSN